MEYQPIKKRIAHMMRRSGIIRKLFYLITGIVFLREWYIKRAVTKIYLDKKYFDEILDAGSGFGQYCYFCKKRFPEAEILGIDINQNYVDDCNYFVKKAGIKRVRFEKSDLTTIDYSDKFDLILSIDVLEHIKDDIRLLSLFNRAVKPEGFVIISTPTLYRKHQKDGVFVDEHERAGYSEQDIIAKLKNSGFTHIEVNYSYGMWGDLSWRFGIRNFMKIFRIGFLGRILAFIYFMVIFPFIILFMSVDYFWPNKRGTGFIIIAQK